MLHEVMTCGAYYRLRKAVAADGVAEVATTLFDCADIHELVCAQFLIERDGQFHVTKSGAEFACEAVYEPFSRSYEVVRDVLNLVGGADEKPLAFLLAAQPRNPALEAAPFPKQTLEELTADLFGLQDAAQLNLKSTIAYTVLAT
jgi:hypothetical protein